MAPKEKPSDHQSAHLPPVILLMGPTASGKSNVAMEIAKRLPVEIVSVDSAQVYRHMNIGTAKPTAATLKTVPHHLVNLIDPNQRYSAAEFRMDALKKIREITARRKIPLLAGGTMLYFHALQQGLSELPPANEEIRLTIEEMAKKLGWPAMHKTLSALDPTIAIRIKPTDTQRIQRALEVCYVTNRPMSEIQQKSTPANLPYQGINIALMPSDRSILHQRIAQRFRDMIRNGLIDEVHAIRQRFRVNAASPAMRCVGYRQTWLYLDNEINLTQLEEMGTAATRQLAKRQLTWLRKMQTDELNTFDCMAEDLSDRVLALLQTMKFDVVTDHNHKTSSVQHNQ
jgi:tRNA dimethylallyltransferase